MGRLQVVLKRLQVQKKALNKDTESEPFPPRLHRQSMCFLNYTAARRHSYCICFCPSWRSPEDSGVGLLTVFVQVYSVYGNTSNRHPPAMPSHSSLIKPPSQPCQVHKASIGAWRIGSGRRRSAAAAQASCLMRWPAACRGGQCGEEVNEPRDSTTSWQAGIK